MKALLRWISGHLLSTPPLSKFQTYLDVLMREPPDAEGHGYSYGHETTDGAVGRIRRSLNPDDWVTADLLAAEGFTILKAGATGNPRGRPRRGVKQSEAIQGLIEEKLNGYAFEELKSSLARGRHSKDRAERRLALAEIVAELLPRTNATALSQRLGCSPSTVYKLQKDAWAQIENKSPKDGESTCWAFEGWTYTGTRSVNGQRPVPLFRPPPTN